MTYVDYIDHQGEEYEVFYNVNHTHLPATEYEPEEKPSVEIEEVFLMSENGPREQVTDQDTIQDLTSLLNECFGL